MTFFASYKDLMLSEMPRMKRAAAAIVCFSAYIFGVWSGTLFPNAFAIFFISAASSQLSALLFMFRSFYVYAVPLITFPTVLFISGSLPSALFSISYVPSAVILAVALYKGRSKANAVFASSISLGITLICLYGIASALGYDIFPSAAEIRNDLEIWFSSIAMNTREGRVPLFTADAAKGLADYSMLSLPAVFITAVNAVSYLSASLLALFCLIFFFADKIPGGRWDFMPEPASAVIFILSYAVSSALVPYAEADVIGFAAENMLLALTPAMMIAGEKAGFALAVKHDRRILFVFLSILILMISSSLYLMLVSFFGAVYVITVPFIPHIKKLFRKDGNDGGDC